MKRHLSLVVCLVVMIAVAFTMSSCDFLSSIIPGLGGECEHTFTSEVTKEATCTEAGEETLTCTECGYSETKAIDPKGHTEEVVPGTAATCTETGLTDGKKCSECGVITVAQETIPVAAHSYVGGICSGCSILNADAPEINVTTTDTYGYVDLYAFTTVKSGTYTLTVPAGLGLYSKAQYDTFGAAEVDFYENADGATINVELAAGATYEFYVGAVTKGDWTITWTFTEGEVGSGDGPVENDPVLNLGSNTVNVGADQVENGVDFTFVAEVDGTYTFGGDLVAIVFDANGIQIGRGQVSLTAGTYTVKLIPMTGAGVYTVRVSVETAGEVGEPDGSEQNPYVWETLPESVVLDYDVISGKVYYIFTATADGSIVFTWPVEGDSWFDIFELDANGNLTNNSASGFMANSHSFVVEAGKSYRVSLGSWAEAGSHTIAIVLNACDHEWSEATCQVLSTCSKCGATTGEYADHIPNSENPTCSDPAECTVCGKEVGYVPHSWDEGVVTQQPDCSTETNGSKLLTCTVCGATQEEEIYAFHDWVVDEETSATCTEDGHYKAHCSVCNKIEEYTTEAQGHYNWFEGSCGDTVACLECGENFVKEHFFWYEASCTQAAYCGTCEQYIGEPAGHQYTYPCDKFCSVCYEETNPNATHTIVHVDAVAATCYENGNVEYWYCSDCGYAWTDEALTQQTNMMSVVVPMAHAPATHVAAVAATCYENGNIEYWYCETCGQAWLDEACTLNTNLKSVVLPMGHAPATHVAAKDATCDVNGNIEYWYCEPCGQAWLDEACTLNTNLKSVVLPAPGHDYVDGICSVCDGEDPNYYFVVSNAEAVAKADGKKVQVTGVVISAEAWNTQHNNMSVTIKDANGDTLYIFRLATQVGLGDTITVKGVVGSYNGTKQIAAGATAVIDVVHGDNHTYANGVCTVCGTKEPVAGETTVKCDFSTVSGTQYADETKTFGDVTVSTHNKGCHFNTQLRIYDSASNDGWAIITAGKTVTGFKVNAGYKAATLNVYGSVDGETWTLIQAVKTTTSYTDYTVNVDSAAGYKFIKIDAVGAQIRVPSVEISYQG